MRKFRVCEISMKDLRTLPTPTRPSVPLSKTTKKHLHGLMHQLFDRAVVWNYLALVRNPMDTVKIKGKATKKRARLVIEGPHLIALAQDEELPLMVKVMLVVGIYSGMRASEILGLRWEAVDFEAGVIHVERSVVGKYEDDTKTEASNATVPLHPVARRVLEMWRDHLPSIAGWVFGNPMTQRPYWRDSIQKDYLKPAGLRIGVADFGWHTLRHSYRYAMKKTQTISLEMQKDLMRHSAISMTVDYGTATMTEEMRLANEEATKVFSVPALMAPPQKKAKSKTGYFGVYEESGMYVAKIAVPGSTSKLYLGAFTDPALAAKAYDKKATELRGHKALLNFPVVSPLVLSSGEPASGCE